MVDDGLPHLSTSSCFHTRVATFTHTNTRSVAEVVGRQRDLRCLQTLSRLSKTTGPLEAPLQTHSHTNTQMHTYTPSQQVSVSSIRNALQISSSLGHRGRLVGFVYKPQRYRILHSDCWWLISWISEASRQESFG